MAGIGFRLRRLGEQDNLLAPIASIGHAAVIVAGPWLFTVIALALINLIASAHVPAELLEGFRLFIVYAFAISLIATAPIVLVATRLVGDAMYLRAFYWIRPLFVAALLFAGGTAVLTSVLFYVLAFSLPEHLVVAGASCSGLVGLIWVGLAFCGIVRDYRGITVGFLAGLCVSVLGAVLAARSNAGLVGMIWAFDAGLAIVFCSLTVRVLATFPQPVLDIEEPVRVLCRGIARYWRLALGGLVAAIAIWIDKWIVWLGPSGTVHQTGLIHAPLYDSAMFTAYLAIIPALSLFMMHVETAFSERYTRYYYAIRTHATLHQIEQNARNLEQVTVQALTQIILIQAAICVIVVLGAPSIVETIGLHYQQVGILKLGALGALFQFVFLAATSLLLYFERHTNFLSLQALFLVLQGLLTAVTASLGTNYYGLGNLIACVICGLIALAVLTHTLRHLTYITFIVRNSSKATLAGSDLLTRSTPRSPVTRQGVV